MTGKRGRGRPAVPRTPAPRADKIVRGQYKPRAVPTAYTKRVRLPVVLCDEIERRGGLRQVLTLALQDSEPPVSAEAEKEI